MSTNPGDSARRIHLARSLRRQLGGIRSRAEPIGTDLLQPLHRRHLEQTKRHADVSLFVTPLSPGGGVISLFELLQTSRRIGLALGFDARMAYQSGHFPQRFHAQGGREPLTSVEAVLNCYKTASRLWFHVPEYQFVRHIPQHLPRLNQLVDAGTDVTVNILNQNIQKMPSPESVRQVADMGRFRLTVTTAHHTYCRQDLRDRFGVPWHHISTWVTPEDYSFARHRTRRANRIVISPDQAPMRDQVLSLVASADPPLDQARVEKMAYEDYLKLVFSSRWSLTFGEGLDGYFGEMGLAGGVPFAVYNTDFFTEDFLELETVFESWPELMEQWKPTYLRLATDRDAYQRAADRCAALLGKYYNRADHIDRLARYYAGALDLP